MKQLDNKVLDFGKNDVPCKSKKFMGKQSTVDFAGFYGYITTLKDQIQRLYFITCLRRKDESSEPWLYIGTSAAISFGTIIMMFNGGINPFFGGAVLANSAMAIWKTITSRIATWQVIELQAALELSKTEALFKPDMAVQKLLNTHTLVQTDVPIEERRAAEIDLVRKAFEDAATEFSTIADLAIEEGLDKARAAGKNPRDVAINMWNYMDRFEEQSNKDTNAFS